jgi:probable HAF family extracellular repeat protein
MTSKAPICVPVVILLTMLTASPRLAAEKDPVERPRYILVDLGTLGGPNSFLDCCGAVPPVLNNRGTVVGGADTSTPDPHAANPNPMFCCEVFINPAAKWQKGVLTNLGALPGGNNSFASLINARGDIVGAAENGGTDPLLGVPEGHPVLWTDDGIVDLGTLGGYEGLALMSNNRGQVVGFAQNAIPEPFGYFGFGTQSRAFLWQDGVMKDLGTLGGNDASSAFVNERGEVAGASYTNSTPNATTGLPTQDPFVWTRERGMIDLGSLGGTYGLPNGLNRRGQVVGNSNLAGEGMHHAFIWEPGAAIKDLGTLGGNNSEAWSLNDEGEVVGNADLVGSPIHHAFLWKNGVMTDLGIPRGGGPCSTAYSINSRGQIVGDSGICHVGGPPFLWENGAIYNLNDIILSGSGLTLQDVDQINDRGEIACSAVLANGGMHACLLVPLGSGESEGSIGAVGASENPSSEARSHHAPRGIGGPAADSPTPLRRARRGP